MSDPREVMRAMLLDAADTVSARGDQYGTPIDDFKRIAVMWNALRPEGPYQPHHVAMYMICLKLSRLTHSPELYDNWLDIDGYASCGWACIHDQKEEVQEILSTFVGEDSKVYPYTINNDDGGKDYTFSQVPR